MSDHRKYDPADSLVNALRSKEMLEALWPDGIKGETIDNVAVLFSEPEAENTFFAHLESKGWTRFNESHDRVRGHLHHPEDYAVRFTFYRDPDDPDFRIESMLLDPIDSGVHAELLLAHGEGCVAQGSYKPGGRNDIGAYQEENEFLPSLGMEIQEVFVAGYGWYTYWKPVGYTIHDLSPMGFLKVRVNLRDTVPSATIAGTRVR